MSIRRVAAAVLACAALLLGAPLAHAQVQTGSITGTVTDTSGAVLPGVNVTVTGDRLIGGPQTQVTDSSGAYRFDRLSPGSYNVKFELEGFKAVDRTDIRINAAFVATVSAKLEVGSLSETITVTGQSPTVDVRSNVQQTVMSQEILEGVPTGRDPWSLAKIIPGVQVSTYDVGGTQSMQQSSMSSHGSNTNDVSYNIDGATVNWPGGGGGDFVLAERGAVAIVRALLVGRAHADGRLAADQARLVGHRLGGEQRLFDFFGIMAVDRSNDMPTVGFEALRRVVGEPAFDMAVDGDAVVVPESDQLAETEGAGQRAGFVRNAFHQAAVAEENVGVVIDDLVAGLVELGGQHLFGQREANGIGDALAERAGGGLDAGRVAEFRVARRLGMQLAEILEIVDGDVVAGQV